MTNQTDLGLPNTNAPIIVSYGVGVDSTAVLIAMHRAGVRPDLILTADTGAEKPETYAYIATMDAWLAKVGFPAITRVKKTPLASTPYSDLEGNCINNETLPSLAFGMHSCSLKWKVDPQDYYVKGCKRGPMKCEPWGPFVAAQAAGQKTIKVIGYDDSPADRKRAGKVHGRTDPDFDYVYPLQAMGWTRDECIRQIKAEGLPVPIKSACWFCPASKKWEILWLAAEHPELFERAIQMELGFQNGKWYRPKQISNVVGLGRTWSWFEWALCEGWVDVDGKVIASYDELRTAAEATKPAQEANKFKGIKISIAA